METVHIALASYENVDAACPRCGVTSRFNRITDFRSTEPVAWLDVACLESACGAPFRIVGDSVNARFEMLVFDCYPLLDQKQYAHCALNLCQAYECFFSLFLRVVLCYEPQRGQLDIVELNANLERLFSETKTWTYGPLRNAFAALVAQHGPRMPATDAAKCLSSLDSLKNTPIDASVAQANPQWSNFLQRLKDNSVASLRNQVVHKVAYRPTRAEVEAALTETRELLFPMAQAARIIGEDSDWYLAAV